jgi:hypothetical protein
MWWILARLAGWNDETSGIVSSKGLDDIEFDLQIYRGTDYVRIGGLESFLNGDLILFSMDGRLVVARNIDAGYTDISSSSLEAGAYMVMVLKNGISKSGKIVIIN